jgi:hypothetical protein
MENEGILRIPPETVRQAGLILLFDGEVAAEVEGLWLSVERNAFLLSLNLQLSTINYLQRRAQPNRYPDFGLIPPSRLPAAAERGSGFWEFVAVTVAQPSRIFTGFPDI